MVVVCAFCCLSTIQAQNPNYGEALQKSLFFYEVQQSGPLPSWNRVSWRADATVNDGSDVGIDLNGGWFDAGDHVKFNFPMAFSVTALAWGAIEFEDAYRNSGQLDILKRNLRFVTDYFIKCHTAPNELYGQVGNGGLDHGWWGSPEVYPLARPSYKIDAANPGSDLAAETAAAMAAVSILLKDDDPAYSATLLTHAEQLFNFADTYRDSYSNSITDAAGFYRSFSGYQDEIVWGAAWMYRATNDPQYLTVAEGEYDLLQREGQSTTAKYKEAFSWDDKAYGAYILLAQLTGKSKYKQDAERNLDYFTVGVNGEIVPKTPGGLPHLRPWGTIRYASNQSLLALIYSDKVTTDPVLQARYTGFAKDMVDYALGDNPINRSFMNGFGNNPANDPHHRGNSGNWTNSDSGPPTAASHILYGAVVGGPKEPGNDSFEDDRGEFIANEVACDYNACITGVLARMYGTFGGTPLANFPTPEIPSRAEIRSFSKFNSNNAFGTTVSVNIQNSTAWPARETDQLSYRYYFDISEGVDAGFTIDDYDITLNNIGGTGTMQIVSVDGKVHYAEISNLPSIVPAGDPAFRTETQINIRVANGVPYDVTNDWSAQGINGTAATESVNIPVYDNGVLVFGTPQGGGNIPNASFTATPESGLVPLTVAFDASASSDPNNDALTYAWDFGDGATGTGVTASHVYTAAGNFTATLTVTDPDGNTDVATSSILVETPNSPPVSAFTSSTISGDIPLTVSFDASGSSDPDGDAITYSWDFGDGSSDTGISPSHIFTAVGVFSVVLTVTDSRGAATTATESITVNAVPNDPPVAAITASAISGDSPLSVTFDASGSTDPDGDVLSYSWDFQNGSTSDKTVVTTVFSTAGTYIVSLTADDGKGGTDVATITISVSPGACNLQSEFGVPAASSLPTITNTTYNHVHVLGTGGPDLSNISDLTINWANESWGTGLWQFSVQTNDGNPGWWNDLRMVSTNTFGSTGPQIVFTNSGFAGLDGTYDVNAVGGDFVMVAANGTYAIYFSNSATPPPSACGGTMARTFNEASTTSEVLSAAEVVIYPNPSAAEFVVDLAETIAPTIELVNSQGQQVKVFDQADTAVQRLTFGGDLAPGIYFLIVRDQEHQQTFKLIKN